MAKKKQHKARGTAKQRRKPGKPTVEASHTVRNDTNTDSSVLAAHLDAVCGLTNLGNTCFFNSAIQALTSVPVVYKYFEGDAEGVTSCGPISTALRELTRKLHKPSHPRTKLGQNKCAKGSVNPQRLFSAVCHHAPHFEGYKQHDSHELLLFLLDGLATEESREDSSSPKMEQDHLGPGLSALFEGKLSSSVVCRSCQHSSVTYEPFMALSLPVPTRRKSSSTKAVRVQNSQTSFGHIERPAAKKLTVKERKRLAKQMRNEAKLKRQTKDIDSAKNVSQGLSVDALTGASAASQTTAEEFHGAPASSLNCSSVEHEAKLLGGSNDDSNEEDPAGSTTDRLAEPAAAMAVDGGSESEPITLQECLSAFFQAEEISWNCPAEQNLEAGGPAGTLMEAMSGDLSPLHSQDSLSLSASQRSSRRQLIRRVSFSEHEPDVKFIPGSSEQRGTDFNMALRGHMPFRRPLSYNGASLLVTADVGGLLRDKMFLRLQPYDDDDVTMSLLARPMRVSTVTMQAVQDSEDEEEQTDVTNRAQLLMNCVADMVEHHGISAGLRAMTCKGMELKRDEAGNWMVHGLGHDDHGGAWQYPHQNSSVIFTPAANILTADLGSASSFGSFGSFGSMGLLSASVSLEDIMESSAMGIGPGGSHLPSGDPLEVDVPDQPGIPIQLGPGRAPRAGPATGAPSAVTAGPMAIPGVLEGKLPGGAKACDSLCEYGGGGSCGGEWLLHWKQDEVAMVDQSGDCSREADAVVLPGCGGAAQVVSAEASRDVAGTAAGELFRTDSSGSSTTAGVGDEQWDDASGRSSPESTFCPSTACPLNAEEGDMLSHMFKSSSLVEDTEAAAAGDPEPSSIRAASQLQPASKKYGLHQAPAVLCIHLKRFQQENNGRLKKLTEKIQFGFELDLSPYVRSEEAQTGAAKYYLAGVVEHSGTMKSGHYVAYIQRGLGSGASDQVEPKQFSSHLPNGSPTEAEGGTDAEMIGCDAPKPDDGDACDKSMEDAGEQEEPAGHGEAARKVSWFYASDSRVSPVNVKEVANCQAYLLVYAKMPC